MKNSDVRDCPHSGKNLKQGKDGACHCKDTYRRSPGVRPSSQSFAQYYKVPGIRRILPEGCRPVPLSLLPEKYVPLLKVSTDDELWEIFRQKAAEAFCKEDSAYCLNIPSFPLCFAGIEERLPYQSRPKIFPPETMLNYAMDDLCLIADEIMNNNNKTKV